MDHTLKQTQIDMICEAKHPDPFSFLGIHKSISPIKNAKECSIRVYLPKARNILVSNVPKINDIKMQKLDNRGFFEAKIPEKFEKIKYKLKVENYNGDSYETYDPYSFNTILSDYDIFLFSEGTHTTAYNKFGAHLINVEGIDGAYFSVWAPNAKRVSVIGNFNEWDGRRNAMRKLIPSGIFEIFIPGIREYELYKFEICTSSDDILIKSDPFSQYNELRPNTASIIYDIEKYAWKDQKWIEKRNSTSTLDSPLSIYECHLQSWIDGPSSSLYTSYVDMTPKLIEYVKNMGYSHVEFMPLMEHPFDGSWGYQVTGYFAPTSRMGEPNGLMFLIDKLHENEIGVIFDWVPGHFPKDAFALEKFDGTCLYEYEDPLKAEHKDWGTLVFNFEKNEVKSFLISNALFWFNRYHIDGLRVDAVASMLYLNYSRKEGEWAPNKYGGKENLEAVEFLKHLNSVIDSYYPNVMMIAEESTSYPLVTHPTYSGGLGFTYKWNMGWMNDFLRYLSLDPYFRKFNHNLLTFTMMYHYSEKYILPLSHDEVVHGKNSLINKIHGDEWQKFATLRTAIAFMFAHPGKKMLFMGTDIGQLSEWDHEKHVDWSLLENDMHSGYNLFVKDMLAAYNKYKAFYELDFSPEGFEWINVSDSDRSIFSFVRYSKSRSEYLLYVFNFTPVVYDGYMVGVPTKSTFKEILNSDSYIYGGSNVGNLGVVDSLNQQCDNKPYSISINIPPLGSLIFCPDHKKSTTKKDHM